VAWTQADADSIKAAIVALVTGQRIVTVTFGDRTNTYQQADLPQLREALAMVEAELGRATRPKQFHGYHRGKGLL
jgi:hypothetical protein